MTRYVLAGHLGPDDAYEPDRDEGTRVTRFDLVSGKRRLGRGIGAALGQLRRLGIRPSEIGVDMIVLAAHVHAADTRLNRIATAQDSWTRQIGNDVPVSDPHRWDAAAPVLARMIRFQTREQWSVAIRPRLTIAE